MLAYYVLKGVSITYKGGGVLKMDSCQKHAGMTTRGTDVYVA